MTHFNFALYAILCLSLGLRLHQVDGFSGSYDEGARVMVAWLMADGYTLYSDIASNQMPWLYQPTAWLFAWGGPHLILARWVEICYATLGIAALGKISRRFWGTTAGVATALFLALEPYYFVNSRLAIGTVSAVAVGGLVIWLALQYQRYGQRSWLVGAGLLYGFSLLLKPLSLVVGLWIAWAIWQRRAGHSHAVTRKRVVGASGTRPTVNDSLALRKMAADGLVVVGTAGGFILLSMGLFNGTVMLEQLVTCRLASKANDPRTLVEFGANLLNYIRQSPILLGLSFVGIVLTTWRRNLFGLLTVFWLISTLFFLMLSSAQAHHLTALSLPLMLLAGYGVEQLMKPDRCSRPVRFGLLTIWLIGVLATSDSYYQTGPRGHQPDSAHAQAVAQLQQVTQADSFVVSDEFAIPFVAGRRVVPELVDVSAASIDCGLKWEDDFVRGSDHQAEAVLFWTDRFVDEFPIFPTWAGAVYQERETFGESRFLVYNKEQVDIEQRLDINFSGAISLVGLSREGATLTFHWRKLADDSRDYAMTLRVASVDGQVLHQQDRQPFHGAYPTGAWPIDVVLSDPIRLDGLALAEGQALRLGVYAVEQPEQLLAVDGAADMLVTVLRGN